MTEHTQALLEKATRAFIFEDDASKAAINEKERQEHADQAQYLATQIRRLQAKMAEAPPTPAARPTLEEQTQKTFGLDPNLDRATLLFMAKNPQGETVGAAPQVVYDLARGLRLPLHAMQGGDYSQEDVARLALDYGMPGTGAASKAARAPGFLKPQASSRAAQKARFIEGAPSQEKTSVESKAIYKRLEKGGVSIPGSQVRQVVGQLGAKIKEELGVSQTLYPTSRGVMGDWLANLKPDKKGKYKTLSFMEMEVMRREALKVAIKTPDESDASAVMVAALDDYIDNIPDMVGVREARALWRKNIKLQDIDAIIEVAAGSASGLENGLVIGFRALLANIYKGKNKNYSADEITAMEAVRDGEGIQSLLRMLRHLGPGTGTENRSLMTFLVMAGGGSAGHTYGGMMGAAAGIAAPAAVGHLAGRAAKARTVTAADMMRAMVARGEKFKKANKKLRGGLRGGAGGRGRSVVGPFLGTRIEDEELRQAILRGDVI